MRSINNLSRLQVFQALDSIGIQHEINVNKKGWVRVRCPYHYHTKKYGPAFINVNTGSFNCYSCGEPSSLLKLIVENKSITYKEAKEYLGIVEHDYVIERKEEPPPLQEEPINNKAKDKRYDPVKKTVDFNPEEWHYCQQRGIDKEWIEKNNVQLCEGGKFHDYMITPIIDEEQEIFEYEARKIKEYEYLVAFYGYDTYDNLKKRFELEYEKNSEIDYQLKYNKEKRKWLVVWKENNKIYYLDDYRLVYLLRPKTYYNSTDIRKILYRWNNLDLSKPVFLEEGLGADSKNRKVFGENVTCSFGSNLSLEQIALLQKIDILIVIPDGDKASIKMIERLEKYIKNLFVVNKILDDREDGYIMECKEAKIIESERWLFRQKEKIKIN